MKKRLIRFICLLLSLSCLCFSACSMGDGSFDVSGLLNGSGSSDGKYTSEQIYAMAEKSVGEIVTYDSMGTGLALGSCFVYSSDGKFVTNYHVIEDAYSAQITIQGNTYNVNRVIAYSEEIDLAVVKVSSGNFTAVSIQKDNVVGGAKIFAVGSSEGFTLSFSTGTIASPNRDIEGVKCIQHDAAISSGNSGGPLYNEYGRVIGVNTMTYTEGQNINFAVACSELDKLDFSKPMSFSEFARQGDPFAKLKSYVMQKGKYSSELGGYSLNLGTTYSSDYLSSYKRIIYYYANTNSFDYDMVINSYYDIYVTIDIDKFDGSYSWAYYDKYDYVMRGTLYASTWTTSSLLGYSYCNAYSSSLKSTIRELATAMVDLLCTHMRSDLSKAGIKPADLGFVNF